MAQFHRSVKLPAGILSHKHNGPRSLRIQVSRSSNKKSAPHLGQEATVRRASLSLRAVDSHFPVSLLRGGKNRRAIQLGL
jgi:hypothetical protein